MHIGAIGAMCAQTILSQSASINYLKRKGILEGCKDTYQVYPMQRIADRNNYRQQFVTYVMSK